MRRLLAGLTGLTALALGCDSGRATPSEPTPQLASHQEVKAPSGETVVQIDNQNFNDMNIYLLDEGPRVFLGAVNGLSTGTLAISLCCGLEQLPGPAAGRSHRELHPHHHPEPQRRTRTDRVLDHRHDRVQLVRVGRLSARRAIIAPSPLTRCGGRGQQAHDRGDERLHRKRLQQERWNRAIGTAGD